MKDIVVIAATNRPEQIDKALLRTGRFDRFVYVNAPDAASRKAIFEIYIQEMPLDDDVDLDRLVELTEHYVGGDIEAVCREAGMRALREDTNIEKVSWRHFEEAFKGVHSSVTKEMLERYSKLDQVLRRSMETDAATLAHYG